MPQNTNLNISPYFDDFREENNYKKVLFKPGTPIQARELTTLQSILQDQIEKFGKHFFKEGSLVIPGQISYDSNYFSVQIDETHLGIPVSLYLNKFKGKLIKGELSGVTAKVETIISSAESERNNYTIYIKYQSSSDVNFVGNTFIDGENLISVEDVFYGVSAIRAGTTFATTLISNSTAVGSAAKIASGVYFIRGFFVNVQEQSIILDQYSNFPSYRVGLLINEELAVASNQYDDLYDNAQGFSNYAAPGADRLKFEVTLIKKEIDNFNDEDFIELLRLDNGVLQKFVKTSNYDLIRDELARRTYDESGDYYVRPFDISLKESLNDRIGNNGMFYETDKTKQGNIPSNSLGSIVVGPGKAYVRGYDVETINNLVIDFDKPRETEKQINQSIPFNIGRQILLNNVYGSPLIGFGSDAKIDLYSDRTITPGVASGNKIGVARIYDFKLRNSEYENAATKFECSLYDVQTYTKIILNSGVDINSPAYIEGNNSSASGYLVSSTGSELLLYQVSGSFNINERISINGIDNGRIIKEIRDYNLSDVHQIKNSFGSYTFTADTVLNSKLLLSEPSTQYTINSSGEITSSDSTFYVGINTGDIISYSKEGVIVPVYNKVTEVDPPNNKITVAPTSTVSGICDGTLPTSTITSNDLKKLSLNVFNAKNSYLYSKLYHKNISNLDLSSSDIIIKKSYDIIISANSYSATLETDLNLTLEQFDEEDYTLTYVSSGIVEQLNDQKVLVSGRSISLIDLSSNGNAILTVTYKKINTKVKRKLFNRSSSLVISGSSLSSSGIGNTTLNDGLIYRSAYGLRVQDKVISLNVPDVVSILGIFESSTINDPELPKIVFESLNSSIDNFISGEQILGTSSGAVAQFVISSGVNGIEIVYLNENKFTIGETVISKETNISGTIGALYSGDRNIKNNFILDNGQRLEYYDYSRLIRKEEVSAPTKKIRVIYNYYTIDPTDSGDFVTVDSYDADRYTKDIGSINGLRISDIIDLRPRVNEFSPINVDYSPFEYEARSFTKYSSSTTNIFAKNKSINLSYYYYLPRIDKLFLTKEGSFIVSKGISSLTPKAPNNLDSSLEICTIYYPAYLYDIKQAQISLTTHKRYRMQDISRIEDRLSNVEYYTSLSLLESDTKNLSIKDAQTGLDRFKCGFFVDNFKSYLGGDISNRIYRASIDTALGHLRPMHYTTSIDLLLGSASVLGIGTMPDPNVDLKFVTDLENPNIKKVGDVVCLDYTDVVFTENKFATRTENVNPFNTPTWIGSIELNPSTDTWVETRKTERVDDIEGNYASTIQQLGVDTNTGLSPVNWNAWETNWTGTSVVEGPVIARLNERSRTSSTVQNRWVTVTTENEWTELRNDTFTFRENQSRQGIQFGVSERFDTTSLGDRVVSRAIITLMRSRNIELVARRMKPSTRLYAFFDNVNVTNFVVPKLIEINMVSGTFQKGEVVTGTMPLGGANRSIRFRIARPDHKYGPYNYTTNPITPFDVSILPFFDTYKVNPYNPSVPLGTEYSSTSTILNVDTASLELQSQSDFFGCIAQNMQLVGETSNAVALVTDIRLITDSSGTFIGSLFIPDPTIPSNPSFQTGTKTLTLTTNPTNGKTTPPNDSIAEANFSASGTIDNIENVTLRIRNAETERLNVSESRTLSETEDRLVAQNRSTRTTRTYYDPIAQSFEVTDVNGVFVTKCDIFFKTKDPTEVPVTMQIRTVQLGTPTQEVLPFSEVSLYPDQISVSDDSTAPTTFTFQSPVYLEGGGEYAIVLLSNSDSYNVWISRMTEVDVTSQNKPESERIIVSQQPTLGSLFKSQNASTWDASQLEDLKFILYRANFTTNTAIVNFYNPPLGVGNRQIASLRSNPIVAYSRKILVGLSQSMSQFDIGNLTPGVKLYQNNYPDFSGSLVSIIGAVGIGSTLSITNAGFGYTDNATYTNIPLKTLTGNGFGAKVDLTIENNVASAATVSIGGTGYSVGDALTIESEYTGGFGKNLILSIPNEVGIISSFNSIIIENVQDNINTSGILNEIQYATSGNTVNTVTNGFVTHAEIIRDGLHFKVNHNNHGMYSDLNYVSLYDIESDISPSSLTAEYNQSSTSNIQLSNVGIFTHFENIEVSLDNPGYIKINNEIIQYTSVDQATSSLSGITRGIDIIDPINPSTKTGLSINSHPVGSQVFKYEFNGISLRRINKTHYFGDVDLNNYPIQLDNYHIKLDMTKSGKDRKFGTPRLHFNETKTGGTYQSNSTFTGTNSLFGPKATQNIPYSIIRPNVQFMTPETTSIEARIRTVTGSSVNGNESSFIIDPFIPVSLNSNNFLPNQKLIASTINSEKNLLNSLGNTSFTMELTLSTTDSKVSPMIDLDRINIITSMNRINSPIVNYKTDPRVNSLFDDPNAAIYVSKPIRLQKSADSLKVYFDAFKDSSNSIIVLYRLLRPDTPDDQQLYELFPGYGNIDDFGNTIDFKENSGLPDIFIDNSLSLDDFISYEYTAKNLPLFNGYQIKIIMSGKNQSVTPLIRDLRVIATI